MNVAFTVLLLSVMYLVTVNRKNRRKIQNLKNQVFELDQLVNIVLQLYVKEEKKKED